MFAWQFTGTNQPLVRTELPTPTPGPGEVLIDVKAAGLCHSDVGALDDPSWMPLFPTLPVTMGHEIAGVVTAIGPDVTDITVGDRVGVCPTAGPIAPGYSRNGGFSPKHVAPATDLVKVPDEVSFALAAMGTDAGMTSYHALATGGVSKGQKVGIIGVGGLGQIGARVAVLLGAEVYVAEANQAVWPMAKSLGVAEVVASIDDLAGRELDVVVDYAGFGSTTANALNAIRHNGTIVVVGMGKLESLINTRDLILNEGRILGSMGGTKEDVESIYTMFATGQITPEMTTIGFEDIPASLDKLRAHEVTGRLVALYE